MKVKINCLLCILERGVRAVNLLTEASDEEVLKVAKELLKLLAKEFDFNQVPSWLGTLRERIIQNTLSNPDIYKKIKDESNKVALELVREILKDFDFQVLNYENFRKILSLAAAANAMEWFIRGHQFSLQDLHTELLNAHDRLMIDDTRLLWRDFQKAVSIMYILDNAGEAVFDLHVVKFLKKFGKTIFVAAKEKPVLNDITVEEAIELGFKDVADDVVPVGWFVGVFLDKKETNPRFLELFNSVDLVIAKGMGAYESLSEYSFRKPVYVILKAKCDPVANSLGVPRGSYVVKRL